MNKFKLLNKFNVLFFAIVVSLNSHAQIKVGDNPTAINTDAVLEIESSDKGVLLPRVGLTQKSSFAPLGAHVAGMFVYNTATANDVTPGIYYNNGSAWVRSDGSSMTSFNVQEDGNASTTITNGDNINLVSGTNMDISRSNNTLTFNSTATGGMTGFNIREDVGTQDNIGNNEIVTLNSGSNMNIVRTGANTFQFNSTNTNTQRSQEEVQDFLSSMVSGNTETGITVTYDDGGNEFDFVVTDASITNEIQQLAINGNTLSINGSGGNSITLPSSSGWSLTGNTATSSSFLGTTNAEDLIFKTGNSERMRIEPAGDIGIGTNDPNTDLHIRARTQPSSPTHIVEIDGTVNAQRTVGLFLDRAYLQFKDVNDGDNSSIYGFNDGLALSAFSYLNSRVANSGTNMDPEIFIRQNDGTSSMYNGSAVGIGKLDPSAMLHIGKGQKTISGTVPLLIVDGNGQGVDATGVRIDNGGFFEMNNALDTETFTMYRSNTSIVINNANYAATKNIGSSNADILIQDERTVFNQSAGIVIPRGTTSQRPSGSSMIGMIRYNTTTGRFEGLNSSGWVNLDTQ